METIILTKEITEQQFIDLYQEEEMNIDSELREQFKLDYPDVVVIESSSNGLIFSGNSVTYSIIMKY